jgi:hypothetical protein
VSTVATVEPTDTVTPAAPSRRRFGPNVAAVTAICLVVLAGYFEVAFNAKTFSSSNQVYGQVTGIHPCGSPRASCGLHLDKDPRADLVASSWALDPWAQVVHRELAAHVLPLWNPYQGAGMPLAANMQSAPFDPLLIPFHLHPTLLVMDLTFLACLILAGIAAYFAARMLGLGVVAATVSGSIFGLSGWFFVYSNNTWWRIHLYLPLVIGLVEWTLRSRRRLPIVLLGGSVAGMIAVGMPEPLFMILSATGLYSLVRLAHGHRADDAIHSSVRLLVGVGLGLALAAPLLLAFREYLPLSFNTHAHLGDQAAATDSPTALLNWISPTISGLSARYAYTRNWVGAGAFLLAVAGLVSRRSMRRYAGWPVVVMGATVATLVYGGGLVSWTHHLPLTSQVYWPVFGTPIIALSLAFLAGIGLQSVADGSFSGRPFGLGCLALVALVVVAGLATSHRLALRWSDLSVRGWALPVIVAAIVSAVILLRVRATTWLVAVAVMAELVLLAPRGFYAERTSAFPTKRWITYLTDHTADGSRVFSADGLLFSDTGAAYGLGDPRMVDALYVDRYWNYLRTFISHGLRDRFIGTGATETAPNAAGNPMFDLLGVRYVLYVDRPGNGPPSWSNPQYQLVDTAQGVRVFENTHVIPRAFVVHEVHRVDGEQDALAYLKAGEPARFPDGSVVVTSKDPRQLAVVEASPSASPRGGHCTNASDSTQIVDYGAASVTLRVRAGCAGLVVLTDQYYPGWKATVNGRAARIYPTDVALRGVAVPAGESTVTFRYRPASFRLGLVISGIALASGACVLLVGTWGRVVRRRRASASGADIVQG